MSNYKETYASWLNSPALNEDERAELLSIAGDDAEIESRFFAPLEFGTAGLRGVMAVGLRRMNRFVVCHATQALAELIKAEGEAACAAGVVICYDCRHHSEEFARLVAGVMAGNGVRAKIFDAMRPTPELSFAIRHYGATAGVNVTSSHNPKEYNGYKVYWSDGAQLPPEHAATVAAQMEQIDVFTGIVKKDFDAALRDGDVSFIGAETDEAFLENVLGQAIDRDAVTRMADTLKIVYTPFHGAGRVLVPEALRRLGVKHLFPVPEQMIPDGDFPTVKSPNPEEPAGFALAIALAKQEDSDLIIGTDPDSDRIGTMVRGADGEYHSISGNQLGVLLLHYIIGARKRRGTMPKNPAAIKTIVTTEMARVVAEAGGVHMDQTFTGFKFMAEKVGEYERGGTYNYLMAYEESYGYMMGSYVRDKDAVTASMMVAEMAAHYFERGMTLLDALNSLFETYGYFAEHTLNLIMPGMDGLAKMQALMKDLRENPPAEISGEPVLRLRDYLTGQITANGAAVEQTEISGMDVLYFEMGDGASFIVRPSGTEPKIKVYILARGTDSVSCNANADRYVSFAQSLAE
ncbi:MAG: phospho-sugar mutase [Firmicutes bacterium]|nr:phospho-sugar mutase [Bacillota bacterium]